MDTKVAITGHEIVQGAKPYVIYTIRMSTSMSSLDVQHRYSEFASFHKQLCYFCHEPVGKDWDLVELIPKLPSSWSWNNLDPDFILVGLIQQRRTELGQYLQDIAKLMKSIAFNKFHPWIRLIRDFLQVNILEQRENVAAQIIQQSFKSIVAKKRSLRSNQSSTSL